MKCKGTRNLLSVDRPQKPRITASQGDTLCACRGQAYNQQPRTPYLKKGSWMTNRQRPEPARAVKWVNKGGREAREEMEQAQLAVALPWHLPGWRPGGCRAHSSLHIPWNKHRIISSPATPACFTACVSSANAEKRISPKSSVGQGE